MSKKAVGVLFGALVLTVVFLHSQVADIGGRVAFASDRDGAWNLYILDLESGLTSRITDFPGDPGILEVGSIHWSKDGRKILFDGFIGWDLGGHYYYVINDDGTDLRRLPPPGGYDYICRWDPRLAEGVYVFEGHNAPPDVLHRIDLISGEATAFPLTWYNWGFDVAPSGDAIYFTRWYFPNSIIGRHDLATHNETTIFTDPEGGAGSIDVNEGDNWFLYDVQIRNASATNNLIKLSPDGAVRIHVTNEVFPSPIKNYAACWVSNQNDGYIVFSTNFFGNDEIVLMKADGSSYPQGMINLTNNPARDTSGEWTQIGSFLEVDIDIKPDTFPNTINLGSNGNVPVAILSTESFDASTVDPLSVSLSGASVLIRGKGTPMADVMDINGDSRQDLIIHVDTTALQLSLGDTSAILTGRTTLGRKIRGSDSVRIVD